jgi:SNF2 family DNA or RNA helicase
MILQHQQEAINKLLKYKVGALFMDAGTGKTRAALELINAAQSIDYILYVAPLRTIKTDGTTSVCDEINRWGGFICKNVDFVGVETISSSDRTYLAIRNRIEQAKNAFIVCDESIKIKNFDAKRTRRLLDLSKFAEYKLILNGTPITRNLLDLWSQMEFLSHKILNMQLVEFKRTFCNYTTITKQIGHRRYTREFITGYENIDYLHNLIEFYVYNCDLRLALQQQYFSFDYTIDEQAKEEYYRLKDTYLDDEMLQWKNNNIFLEMTQKMQHTYCCTLSKIDVCRIIFEQYAMEDKTIIFCKYVASQLLCKECFPKAKVLSYQTSALGLNLQDYHYTIYFDKIWDYYLRSQSGNRTYRIGQTKDCLYFDLNGDVGLESLIDKNVAKKISMVEYFKKVSKTELQKVL